MRHVSSIWRKTLLPSRQLLQIAGVARAWHLHHGISLLPTREEMEQLLNRSSKIWSLQNSKTCHPTNFTVKIWRSEITEFFHWFQRWQREMNRPKTSSLDSTIRQQTNTRNKGPTKTNINNLSSRWLDVVSNLSCWEYFLFGLRMVVKHWVSCWRMVKSSNLSKTWMSQLFLGFSCVFETLSKFGLHGEIIFGAGYINWLI